MKFRSIEVKTARKIEYPTETTIVSEIRVGTNYWIDFFKDSPQYLGWRYKQDETGFFVSWDGSRLGYSLNEVDMRRAIDILEGRV